MGQDENGIKIKTWHVAVPVLIGVAVVVWLFADEFGNFDWSIVKFTPAVIVGLLLAIVAVAGREWGYMWRYRHLTDGDLSWVQAFKVTMLCEFTSAITPSSVGGSSVAMVFMSREGINFGRGTTLMIITLFLDELYFTLSCPLIVAFTPFNDLFGTMNTGFSAGLKWVFWGVYVFIATWTVLLYIGIIAKPRFIKRMLVAVFSLPLLRRWKGSVETMTDNMVAASVEARNKPLKWWVEAFVATAMSWTCRYAMVCFLFLAFAPGSDQWLAFARQGVIWLLLLVCPTPGGSGVSEWLFSQYYADMVVSMQVALVVALAWRIFSYYIYLIIGLAVIPSWLKPHKK